MRVGVGAVLARLRPVPAHLGGRAHGHLGDVAGLAGHGGQVRVEAFVVVGRRGVAVRARDASRVAHADRHAPPGDLVIARAVAVDALEVVAAHMDVDVRGGMNHRAVEVPVLDRVPAAPAEVAGAAVRAGGSPHGLRRGEQIDVGGRQSAGSALLAVLAAAIVADEAVDPFGVGEVEGGVGPAVAGMTGGAGRPVGLDGDAEVVDEVLLADGDGRAGALGMIAGPGPVRRVEHVPTGLLVAAEAGAGDLGAGFGHEPLEEGRVVRAGAGALHPRAGIVVARTPRVLELDERDREPQTGAEHQGERETGRAEHGGSPWGTIPDRLRRAHGGSIRREGGAHPSKYVIMSICSLMHIYRSLFSGKGEE